MHDCKHDMSRMNRENMPRRLHESFGSKLTGKSTDLCFSCVPSCSKALVFMRGELRKTSERLIHESIFYVCSWFAAAEQVDFL